MTTKKAKPKRQWEMWALIWKDQTLWSSLFEAELDAHNRIYELKVEGIINLPTVKKVLVTEV